ncbi:hypothetical protein Nepgr_015660 [Nepenthes gracilis]|uniref:Uncharacterized protein n=1 Tax=Nepenthes gracilis TaxID=150966 RepID=A0AAD3SN68_NEPGR|nr:hypothetical protein Nepgr_015660 [Nepenthes gracilis]
MTSILFYWFTPTSRTIIGPPGPTHQKPSTFSDGKFHRSDRIVSHGDNIVELKVNGFSDKGCEWPTRNKLKDGCEPIYSVTFSSLD